MPHLKSSAVNPNEPPKDLPRDLPRDRRWHRVSSAELARCLHLHPRTGFVLLTLLTLLFLLLLHSPTLAFEVA